MWYLIATYEKNKTSPHTFGPCETKEEAEKAGKPFEGREGWTVEVIYKEEPYQHRDFV